MRKLWPLALLLAACGAQDVGAGLDPLRLTATSLPPAYLGEPYSASLAAEGGVRPYSFTLDGKLPEGLSFQGGRLFGVPKEKGSFPLLLTVEEEAGLRHRAVNESRVAVRFPEGWKVVHVHKSPAG